jgi:hypothetical protein
MILPNDLSFSANTARFRDTGSFGSLQALPSFVNDFGVAGSDGEYTLPATRRAMLNSLPWLGKIIGCFGAEVIIGHFGFKKTMYLTALIQIVAVVSESSITL